MKSKEEEGDLLSKKGRSWKLGLGFFFKKKLGLGFVKLEEGVEVILALSSANASQNALCVMKLSFLFIKISPKTN